MKEWLKWLASFGITITGLVIALGVIALVLTIGIIQWIFLVSILIWCVYNISRDIKQAFFD